MHAFDARKILTRVATLALFAALASGCATLRTDLPSEQTLQAMIEEGERMGWTYGPPRH